MSISHLDGTKIVLENDNWALLRFSGTEPVLRMFVEADSPRRPPSCSTGSRASSPRASEPPAPPPHPPLTDRNRPDDALRPLRHRP
ncbi:hypothetical protein NKG05_09310 [Oerskovia sp. M15]